MASDVMRVRQKPPGERAVSQPSIRLEFRGIGPVLAEVLLTAATPDQAPDPVGRPPAATGQPTSGSTQSSTVSS